MDGKPAAAGPAVNRDDLRQADVAQEEPLVQPDNARPRDTLHQRCRSDAPARKASNCPPHAAGNQRMRASFGSPTTHDVEHEH